MSAVLAYKSNDYEPEQLSNLGLFQGGNLLSFRSLLNQVPIFDLAQGEVLTEAGKPVPACYMLIQGRMQLWQGAPAEDGTPDRELLPGDCCGELAMVSRAESPHTIVAAERSVVMALDEDNIMHLITSSHTVARNFLFLLMDGLKRASRSASTASTTHDKAERVTHVDELTGLHNARWLTEMLDRQILRSATAQSPLSVLMFDLDQFMNFQEDFGKPAADQALYTLGQLVMQNARPTDMYARYKEDKFVVVLPETDLDGARIVAERMKKLVAETQIAIPGECMLPPMSVSVGMLQLGAFVSAEKMLEEVQEAVARAKADSTGISV